MRIPGKKLLAKAVRWLVEKVGDELEKEFDKAREQSGVTERSAPTQPPPRSSE